ncbi:hexaprenyldihydroxybenzoate methyltransferase [Aureococcus anophagefferens]|nr:hexaprenyldihydroxybenzoate methyltransferase [Aureococcus anophagefferens]
MSMLSQFFRRALASRAARTTRDAAEVAKFQDVDWADPSSGSGAGPLHALNPVRVGYITDRADVAGATVLDVGSAAACSLGCRWRPVTGDLARDARHCGAYDVVCALEVVEHVADARLFVESVAALARPGGDVFVSTLNRTPAAYALGVVLAESVLGLLPPGTHDWSKFVTPRELAALLGESGCAVQDASGVHYVPGPFGLQRAWLAPGDAEPAINFIVHAKKRS